MRLLKCDKCGANNTDSTWPDGWEVRQGKDLCPDCFGLYRGFKIRNGGLK